MIGRRRSIAKGCLMLSCWRSRYWLLLRCTLRIGRFGGLRCRPPSWSADVRFRNEGLSRVFVKYMLRKLPCHKHLVSPARRALKAGSVVAPGGRIVQFGFGMSHLTGRTIVVRLKSPVCGRGGILESVNRVPQVFRRSIGLRRPLCLERSPLRAELTK